MNFRILVSLFVFTIAASGFANDHKFRAAAKAHFERGMLLEKAARAATSPTKNPAKLEESKTEYAKGIKELCSIKPANRSVADMKNIYRGLFKLVARAKGRPPCCSLCLLDKKLIGSHVIPESVLKRLGKSFLCSSQPNQSRAPATCKWPIFCKPGCEDLFSDLGEKNFAVLMFAFIDALKTEKAAGFKAPVTFSAAPSDNSVHYCVASVVFRNMLLSGLSELQPFIAEYGFGVEDGYWRLFFKLRDYLLDPQNAPATHIELFISDEDIGENHMINSICTTYPNSQSPCFTTAHFEFSGLHFLVTESSDVRRLNAKDYTLPQNAFSLNIRPIAPGDTFVFSVLPNVILAMPHIVTRARQFDAIFWRKTLLRVSGVARMSQNAPASQNAGAQPVIMTSLPTHPLSDWVLSNFPLDHVSRLPDDIVLNPATTARPIADLRFSEPDKFNILAHEQFVLPDPCEHAQLWFCENRKAKKNSFFAVFHWFLERVGSYTFGYQIDDRHLKPASTEELEGLVEVSEAKGEAEAKKWLGLKPITGTDHMGIEFVSASATTHAFLFESLLKLWAKTPVALSPETYTLFDGEVAREFRELNIDKDGNCAFRVIGVERRDAIEQLIDHANDMVIREMVANDIHAAFIAGELPHSMRNAQVEELRQKHDILDQLTNRLIATLRAVVILPPHELLIYNAMGDDFDWAAFFRTHPEITPESHQEDLRKLIQLQTQLNQTVENIFLWARHKSIFQHFVYAFLGAERQWLTYLPGRTGLFDAVARLNNVAVDIFVPDADIPNQIRLNHQTPNRDRGIRLVQAIHTDRLTHFNILEEIPYVAPVEDNDIDVNIRDAIPQRGFLGSGGSSGSL